MEHPNPQTLWTHRRWHAYLSLLGLFLLLIAAVLMPPEQIDAASPLLTSLAYVFAAVLLLYAGASTVEDVARIRR